MWNRPSRRRDLRRWRALRPSGASFWSDPDRDSQGLLAGSSSTASGANISIGVVTLMRCIGSHVMEASTRRGPSSVCGCRHTGDGTYRANQRQAAGAASRRPVGRARLGSPTCKLACACACDGCHERLARGSEPYLHWRPSAVLRALSAHKRRDSQNAIANTSSAASEIRVCTVYFIGYAGICCTVHGRSALRLLFRLY